MKNGKSAQIRVDYIFYFTTALTTRDFLQREIKPQELRK